MISSFQELKQLGARVDQIDFDSHSCETSMRIRSQSHLRQNGNRLRLEGQLEDVVAIEDPWMKKSTFSGRKGRDPVAMTMWLPWIRTSSSISIVLASTNRALPWMTGTLLRS